MNILTTSTSAQSLIFIPRKNCLTPLEIVLTSEDTNTSVTYSVTATCNNHELTITQSFNLKEGVYYSYKVSDGVNLMYRGKIFCTDQTGFDKYIINSGDFVEATAQNNEFITP